MRVVNQMLASVTIDSLTQQNEMIEEKKIERTDGRVCDIWRLKECDNLIHSYKFYLKSKKKKKLMDV